MMPFSDIHISQGSVATRLGCGGGIYISLCYKFATESNSERILKICKYLVKLWASRRRRNLLHCLFLVENAKF